MDNKQFVGETERKSRSFLGAGLAMVLAGAAFFSGLQIGLNDSFNNGEKMQAGIISALFASPKAPAEDVNLDEFWRVWNLMDEKYVVDSEAEPITDEMKLHGAIAGLVASYNDPYSVFFPPKESEEFNETISGNFSGVGMEVGIRNDLITVIAPLPNTPAEKAGILSGDVIAKIDGETTERLSIDQAVDLIRGEQGTTVNLTVFREGESELLEISVVRDVITIPTIDTKQEGDVFIISLYNFNALSEAMMQDALREYVQSGTKKMILDLRGNPGGFLQSANAIASYFLPAGKIIVREDFGGGQDQVLYRSQGKVLHDFAPDELVVLVDGGSASASEILAGALQEHKVATLIGETTFGKGSVQELIDLPNKAALKVTIARWFTPNGKSISEGGLEPDLVIERTPQDRLNDIDPQLEAALKWVHGERDFVSTLNQDEEAETE
ncbi:S41 family peptidase [Candidatus Kaiserbacteria bacterium]|nr:S41 family peptidase [Candidatus Kaiserbacteria bacterium]